MKRIVLIMLFLMTASVAFSQIKDYSTFEWGDSRTSVVNRLQLTGQSIQEIGDNHITVYSETVDGYPIWETYLFTNGLGLVLRESVTQWRVSDDIELIYDYYLPNYMLAIKIMSDGPFENYDGKNNYRMWAGPDSVAASYYLADSQGRFRVFGFVARLSEIEIATGVLDALNKGVFLDFESLIDPAWLEND